MASKSSLCRQDCMGGGSIAGATGAGGRRGTDTSRVSSVSSQFSDGPQHSPSSTHSSTPSWSEEPAQSNMDISTGHMILVGKGTQFNTLWRRPPVIHLRVLCVSGIYGGSPAEQGPASEGVGGFVFLPGRSQFIHRGSEPNKHRQKQTRRVASLLVHRGIYLCQNRIIFAHYLSISDKYIYFLARLLVYWIFFSHFLTSTWDFCHAGLILLFTSRWSLAGEAEIGCKCHQTGLYQCQLHCKKPARISYFQKCVFNCAVDLHFYHSRSLSLLFFPLSPVWPWPPATSLHRHTGADGSHSGWFLAGECDMFSNLLPFFSCFLDDKQERRPLSCLQMVWENGCTVIVMMTALVEDGEKQSERYWPDEGSSLYHIYEVIL